MDDFPRGCNTSDCSDRWRLSAAGAAWRERAEPGEPLTPGSVQSKCGPLNLLPSLSQTHSCPISFRLRGTDRKWSLLNILLLCIKGCVSIQGPQPLKCPFKGQLRHAASKTVPIHRKDTPNALTKHTKLANLKCEL